MKTPFSRLIKSVSFYMELMGAAMFTSHDQPNTTRFILVTLLLYTLNKKIMGVCEQSICNAILCNNTSIYKFRSFLVVTLNN